MIPIGNLSSGEQSGRRWEKEGKDRGTIPKKQNDKREWDGRSKKKNKTWTERGKRETQNDPCRFVHVGTEGSPAGSQSNKVVRGCFAGCKFSPCGLSVSILLLLLLLLLLFPLSFCNCWAETLYEFPGHTEVALCSRSPIHNPLYPPCFSFASHPFVRLFILTLSNPDRRRIAITRDQLRLYMQWSNLFCDTEKKMHIISYVIYLLHVHIRWEYRFTFRITFH